jgi:hypothetical protein
MRRLSCSGLALNHYVEGVRDSKTTAVCARPGVFLLGLVDWNILQPNAA